MKVCILSDSHDRRDLLRAAVQDAKGRGAQVVLHGGDVVSPSTLSVLQDLGLPVHVVHGNNGGDLVMLTRMAGRKGSVLSYHGADMDLELGGRRIFMVHYPHYARGMATLGDWDLVCCGHSHRSDVETLSTVKGGTCIFVDAGTVGGVGAPPTYVLGDLEQMRFEIQAVPGG